MAHTESLQARDSTEKRSQALISPVVPLKCVKCFFYVRVGMAVVVNVVGNQSNQLDLTD